MHELASLLTRHARYRPESMAVVCDGERLDYRAFARRVARAGNLLRSLGIRAGDTVATACANSLDLFTYFWAVPSIGATLAPLSPLLLADGLASLLRGADARLLIADRALLPVLEQLGERRPELVLLLDAAASGCIDGRAGLAAQPEELVPARVRPEDVFNIMFTSGTTGDPKGIMHSHAVRAAYCTTIAAALRMTPESRTLHTGAIVFNGAFAIMLPTLFLGAAFVLHRQFDPRATLETIERERITHMMVVPAQLVALLRCAQFDAARLASLECVLSLGAPLLKPDKDRFNAALPGRLYELYGLTEGFITVLDRDDAVRKAGSVGVPPPFFHVRVVRDDGSDAAPGEVGEILGYGPITMSGYYKRPDLTAQTLRDGWIHSGDLGYLDEDGFLYLVDRRKDMIDSGGVKVYPRDIEEVAARHPDVREVAVFGVPHDTWGEAPLAAVILREGAPADAGALRDWINERVAARYQRVAGVVVMTDFPRSAAGKTLKRELRAPFWAGSGRTI